MWYGEFCEIHCLDLQYCLGKSLEGSHKRVVGVIAAYSYSIISTYSVLRRRSTKYQAEL
jgi:hypothetical protein